MSGPYRRHRFPDALVISELISLFSFKSPKNYYFPGESHDFWEFIYADKGQLLITAGRQQYLLKAGELAFHKPDEFHAIQVPAQVQANFIVAAFVCKSAEMRVFEHRILGLAGPARDCLHAAVREARGHLLPVPGTKPDQLEIPGAPFGAAQLIRDYLEQMLIHLYRQEHRVQIQQRAASYAQKARYRELAAHVRAYLEIHVEEQLTLDHIARDLGYSVSQMKKLFKAETGDSIINTLIALKMDEARRMIEEGELSFGEIAVRLGYDNPQYFSRLFKNRHEMTPTEYSRSLS
jgi:AraC-like DNA-binding protein